MQGKNITNIECTGYIITLVQDSSCTVVPKRENDTTCYFQDVIRVDDFKNILSKPVKANKYVLQKSDVVRVHEPK